MKEITDPAAFVAATTPQPKCNLCGYYCRKVNDQWRCPQVFWDDYTGGWEHA